MLFGCDVAVRRCGVHQAMVSDGGALLDGRAHHRCRRASRREGPWQHDARDCQSADDAMKVATARGFSFIELVVSMAIMLAITGSMFGLVDSARTVFGIDLERADMQQRARVSM